MSGLRRAGIGMPLHHRAKLTGRLTTGWSGPASPAVSLGVRTPIRNQGRFFTRLMQPTNRLRPFHVICKGAIMKAAIASIAFAAVVCCNTEASFGATAFIINPTSDGSLYTCDTCNVVSDGAYVATGGYIQGAVKFSSAPII